MNEPSQVHGIIYREAFGESCNNVNVVGEGFGIINGEFLTKSFVFNSSNDDYHNDSWEMHAHSTKCVRKVVEWWKKADLTAAWLAQLVERQSAVREVEGSSPRRDQHSGP